MSKALQNPGQKPTGLVWSGVCIVACRLEPGTMDAKLTKDLKVLSEFIATFCRRHHPDADKTVVAVRSPDSSHILLSDMSLCSDCRKLFAHASAKRYRCPMQPKPACRHCPDHCYHPTYRQQIRHVMRSSGTRMLLAGRINYLWRMLF